MNKLFVIHYYPLDYFPPVVNLIEALQDKAKLSVVSTRKSNLLTEYNSEKVRIYKPVKENKKDTSLKVLIKYGYFTIYTLWKLICEKPAVILYYESISALAPYLYKRFINRNAKLCIHYHEYMTREEYDRPGMRLSKFNHNLEISYLYKNAYWISQTNQYRKDFFLKDYPFIPQSIICPILPNYPPKAWHVQKKKYAESRIIKCVYVGSLSLKDTFIKEFCEWVSKQQGRVIFDIYSFNFHVDVKVVIKELDSPYISFHEEGVTYSDLPKILCRYDVGLLLYRATTLNVKYCETNKFYEYLISGLDVWYPKEMTLLHEMDKSVFAPHIVEMDFQKNRFPEIDLFQRVIDNSNYDKFAETIYEEFLNFI